MALSPQSFQIMNNRMTLKDLRLFCQVARAGGFAAVARAEGMSPAFVSKRIASLEQALSARLLQRTTRSVSLTRDGETVLRRAQAILADIDEMADLIAADRTTPRGLLRLTSSPGFGRERLAPALSALIRRHPELDVHLELIDRAVDLIGEGFDLDIRVGGPFPSGLIVQRLARNQRLLCAAPAYLAVHGTPERLQDLARHRCIVTRERDQTFGLWRMEGPNGVESVKVPTPLSCNNGEVAHRWGVDGHGIFLRSLWDVAAPLRDGRLIRVLPRYRQEADIVALYPQRLTGTGRLDACVRFLKDWFDADSRTWLA